MKKSLLLLLPFFLLTLATQALQAQCHAQFTWEQLPGTLQIHFHSTSTSENDIISYSWNFGDGHEGDGSNPYHTYNQPGTYLVCLVIMDNEGCASDVCHEVTIEGLQSDCNAEFTWEQIPGTLQIHFNSTSTSEHDIISIDWHFGDGDEGEGDDPYHTYDEPGTYAVCIRIEDNTGCVSELCHEVTVAPLVNECHAAFTWEQIPGTLQIHFNSTSTSQYDIISYSWNFGDAHFGDGNDPYHTYAEPGEYVVCLLIVDSEGCASDVCHEITVGEPEDDCHAEFTWEQIPGTLQIHFNSTSTSEHDIISITWHFGDGDEGEGDDPYHTYDEPGTYVVCIRIEDNTGCVSELCHEVTVGEPEGDCHADFSWDFIEGTNSVHFFSQSTSEHDIISYHWTFGDGHDSDDQNPSHEYGESGTYLVCLRIEDNTGCVSEICHEVTVGEPEGDCHADFSWDFIEGTNSVHFFSQSTSEHDIISYHWTFGDGHDSDDQNPSHEYDEPGTYLVCLRIEDNTGCVSEICHEVTIGQLEGCHAQFTWEQIPGTYQIHFNSTSTSENDIVTYSWNFGDGHLGDGNDPYHTYEHPGVYVVCLLIVDSEGCASDVCHEVTVGEPEGDCHAAFTWDTIVGTWGVHFFSQSTSEHDIISYHWTFGDGHDSNVQNPSHEYNHPGIYVVCLRIEDNTGCVSEICHEVLVGEPQEGCQASFNWEQIPGTLQIHFNSTSTSEHDIVSYSWNFGDGTEGDGDDPYHTYEHPGVYVVCLYIVDSEGCTSHVCHEVTVGEPECTALFSFEMENGIVFFNNNSTGGTQHTEWFWQFGDGHTSTEENPQHEYNQSGAYTVCLLMTDSTLECAADFCLTIEVNLGSEPIEYDDYPEGARDAATKYATKPTISKSVRYTNPVDQSIAVDYLVEDKGVVQIEIYNLYGHRLYLDRVDNVQVGVHQHTMDVSHLQPGLYMLSLMINGERRTMGVTVSR